MSGAALTSSSARAWVNRLAPVLAVSGGMLGAGQLWNRSAASSIPGPVLAWALTALLRLLALLGLRARVPGAATESMRLPRGVFALTSVWSAGLLYASLWPGAFEQDWEFLFWFTAPVLALGWLHGLVGRLGPRQFARARPDPGSARAHALLWLTATTVYCSLLGIVYLVRQSSSSADRLAGLFFLALALAPVHCLASVLLRELPAQAGPLPERAAGRRVAISVLRCASIGVALRLCAGNLLTPAFPLFQAGLVLLGGLHFLLESSIRQLPLGAHGLRWTSAALACALAVVLLVELDLPLRASIELTRGELDACAAGEELGLRRVGIWNVEVARDPRGGAFLATWSDDVDSDDHLTVGLAHRPNVLGTPFGDRRSLRHLTGDWYEFRARRSLREGD